MKRLNRSKDGALDWFSKLPEHLIHHILSLVPIKDAARTRILSKTWKSLCSSYNIVPLLHYDHNSFALQLLLNAESEPKIDEIRDKFTDYAETHLQQVIQQQSRVFKLSVDVAVIDSEFACVDQFMELVRKVKVQELSIFVQTRDFLWYDNLFEGSIFYEFPYSLTLASEWLESLTVKGCKFTNQLSLPCNNNNGGMFSSLRQLWLSQVLLLGEEALSNIARCCPGIELLDFDTCTFFVPTLKLSNFPKLKKASVKGDQYGLENVDITETSLESFYAISVDMEYLISRAACSNIRELELHSCSVNQPDLLQDLTTYFPLLETAKLSDVTVTPSEDSLDMITAANPHLKTLELLFNRDIKVLRVDCPDLRNFRCLSCGFEEIYMNCPKLRTCYYSLRKVPRLILLDLPTNIQHVFFSFSLFHAVQMSWFISLRKFLEQIGSCNNVYLQLHILLTRPNMAEFVLDEFREVQTSKLNNVHLQVEIFDFDGEGAQISSVPLVDGLVWSIQPATLSVGGRSCYDFVKYLCENLAEKSRDKSCCDQQLCNKYWWHNISDFQVKHRNKDMKQNLASLMEMCRQSCRGLHGQLSSVDRMPTCFIFEWHSIERFTEKLLVEMAASSPTST